jgi:hypothetical protein
MPRRHAGVIDTCTFIDLADIDPLKLPAVAEITAVTLAELHQGVAMAKEPTTRAARAEKLAAAVIDFDPLPFDRDAASRYGTLVALTVAYGRDPKPRRLDLMIAAIASTQGMPLFTRNAKDFGGLESALTVIAV